MLVEKIVNFAHFVRTVICDGASASEKPVGINASVVRHAADVVHVSRVCTNNTLKCVYLSKPK